MPLSDSDKLVAATLAAAKASSAKVEKPLDYVLEYEQILKVMDRRNSTLAERVGKKVLKPGTPG